MICTCMPVPYVYLWKYFFQSFLEWEMFQIKFMEKIKTHILYSITIFFRNSCRLWDNVEKYGTARYEDIIWSLHLDCWITKATDTLLMCNNYCFCTATMVKRQGLNVAWYLICVSCLFLSEGYYSLPRPQCVNMCKSDSLRD
jgi:hypothetical protein